MRKPVYIKDFNDDLTDKKVILFIGHVDTYRLYNRLTADMISRMHEFNKVVDSKLMCIVNGNLEHVDTSYLIDYLSDGNDIYNLYYDSRGYYIIIKI